MFLFKKKMCSRLQNLISLTRLVWTGWTGVFYLQDHTQAHARIYTRPHIYMHTLEMQFHAWAYSSGDLVSRHCPVWGGHDEQTRPSNGMSCICWVFGEWHRVCGFLCWAGMKIAMVLSTYIHTYIYIYIISIHINTTFFHWVVWKSYLIAMCTRVWPATYKRAWASDLGGGGWLVDSWPSLCYTSIDRIKGIFQFPKLKEYILVVCVRVCQSITQKSVSAPFIWAGALGPGPACGVSFPHSGTQRSPALSWAWEWLRTLVEMVAKMLSLVGSRWPACELWPLWTPTTHLSEDPPLYGPHFMKAPCCPSYCQCECCKRWGSIWASEGMSSSRDPGVYAQGLSPVSDVTSIAWNATG